MFYPVRKYQHVSFIIPNINQQYYYKLKKYIPLLSFVDKLMPPLSLHLLTPLPLPPPPPPPNESQLYRWLTQNISIRSRAHGQCLDQLKLVCKQWLQETCLTSHK